MQTHLSCGTKDSEMTKNEAIKATRYGSIAGLFIAALTLFITYHAISSDASEGALVLYNSSANY